MPLAERLMEDLKDAMRRRDTITRETIRLLRAALKNAEIEHGGPLPSETELAVIQREIKRRREAIEWYQRGNRPDLVAKEEAELAVLQHYLPTQLSAEEVTAAAREVIAAVGASGPRDLGKVMGPLMGRLRGQAEGATVNRIVRDLLGAS